MVIVAVVRDSPRIQGLAKGRAHVPVYEGVAEPTRSVRSYAPVLILALARTAVLGPRVTREGIVVVGRGRRVLELALL